MEYEITIYFTIGLPPDYNANPVSYTDLERPPPTERQLQGGGQQPCRGGAARVFARAESNQRGSAGPRLVGQFSRPRSSSRWRSPKAPRWLRLLPIPSKSCSLATASRMGATLRR